MYLSVVKQYYILMRTIEVFQEEGVTGEIL